MARSKLERILILVVFVIAILVVFVNISLLTTSTFPESGNHHGVTKIHFETSGRNLSHVVGSQGNSEANEKSGQTSDNPNAQHADVYTVDEKLMRILRHVGIESETQLSPEDRSLLPTWDEVVDRVGNDGPKILGLDTCKAYRSKVPQGKRKLAVAGPFNSGTHYLNEVMSNNCIYKIPGKITAGNKGVLHQVSLVEYEENIVIF